MNETSAADRVNRQAREAAERSRREALADEQRMQRATTTPRPVVRERSWPNGQKP